MISPTIYMPVILSVWLNGKLAQQITVEELQSKGCQPFSCGHNLVGSGLKHPPFLNILPDLSYTKAPFNWKPPFLNILPDLSYTKAPFNWKFLTPTLFTICFTFVHLLLIHTYIEERFCPPLSNHKSLWHHWWIVRIQITVIHIFRLICYPPFFF